MKNGTDVLLRPIRPEDEPAMVKFHETLSDRSVYLRFFHMQKLSARVAHERLLRKCFIDYDREMALVAEYTNAANGEHEVIAVGRLTRQPGTVEAEVAVLVADQYQHQGLGAELLARLIQVARDEKLDKVVATILPENMGMRALASRFGFVVQKSSDMDLVKAVLALSEN
jgi:acetyltransferase